MKGSATPNDLVLVNRYDASPEQVWAAWTDPDNLTQWWCVPDWEVSDVVIEPRPGGRFQQTQISPDGEITVPFTGFYREVSAPERLVLGLDMSSPDDEPGTILTVQLRATDGGTEQEFRQTGAGDDEELKAGTEYFFTRLGQFLAR